MKLTFRSNITPDIEINTRGGAPGNKIVRAIMEWIRPALYGDNSFIPIAAEPYGRPTAGRGSVNLWWVIVVVGGVVALATYGGLKLLKR